MKLRHWLVSLPVAVASCCVLLPQAQAARAYKTTVLRALDPSIDDTSYQPWAAALNDLGQAVGSSGVRDEFIKAHPVLWDAGGQPRDLGILNGWGGNASGLNNTGTVIGHGTEWLPGEQYGYPGLVWQNGVMQRSTVQTGANFGPRAVNDLGIQAGSVGRRAAVWNGQALQMLPDLGGEYAQATGIDASGSLVVGKTDLPPELDSFGFGTRAVAWQDGRMIDLGSANEISSEVQDITATGLVLVSRLSDRYRRSYDVWDGQTFTPVDVAGPQEEVSFDQVLGMNSAGQFVGSRSTFDGSGHRALLWDKGLAIDLDNLLDPELKAAGWRLDAAVDINEKGQILVSGNWFKPGDVPQGGHGSFVLTPVLTPVPEPQAWQLSLTGLMLMSLLARRSRATAFR